MRPELHVIFHSPNQNQNPGTWKSWQKSKRKERSGGGEAYGGEGVGGVGDEHAGLADGAVPDRDALYEPGRAHPLPPSLSLPFFFLLLLVLRGNKKRDGKWGREPSVLA